MQTVFLTRSLSIEAANIEMIQAPERSGAARMTEGGLSQFHVSALYRTTRNQSFSVTRKPKKVDKKVYKRITE